MCCDGALISSDLLSGTGPRSRSANALASKLEEAVLVIGLDRHLHAVPVRSRPRVERHLTPLVAVACVVLVLAVCL